MAVKLLKWGLFTVIVSLLPFFLTGVDLWTDGKIDKLFSMWRRGDLLWPHGELLLVSIAIAADAAGGLIASGPRLGFIKIAAAGGAFILAIGAAGWYEKIQEHSAHVLSRIVEGSGVVFGLTIVVALVCTALED
jgi:hypothetical protein